MALSFNYYSRDKNMYLNIDSNAKTIKGQKKGFLTGILYLAPYKLAGINLCPMAELAQCHGACLNKAGRGAFTSTQTARINKTKKYHNDKNLFMLQIIKDIKTLIRKADKMGFIPIVRLNGTSDIRFESVKITYDGIDYPNIMAIFPELQFYDYTKIANRKNIPSNYDLTFSYSGVKSYDSFVKMAIEKKDRIAVVFRSVSAIPEMFLGLPVINGDDSDLRHIDNKNCIVALYAKGKAKKDYSGFVVG